MRINQIQNSNTNFRGTDIVRLRGLYMQAMTKPYERRIFREMKKIAKLEGFDLFINENNKKISTKRDSVIKSDLKLSIWAQDRKAFVQTSEGKNVILANSEEKLSDNFDLGDLNDYEVVHAKYMPRGGNYYLGTNQNGERWILINGVSITDAESFKRFDDVPTLEHINKLFDVKPENIFIINDISNDLDEKVRPVGFPNILINDYSLALENLEKMKEKFPKSNLYPDMKNYLEKELKQSSDSVCSMETFDKTVELLKSYGFNPIPIAGNYYYGINFLNAIAFENKNNKLSYITNSTKYSAPELEYLEELFKEDLKSKVPQVEKIYCISGGKFDGTKKSDTFLFYNKGFDDLNNSIMHILSNRLGGIHCMCAEIPEFKR